MLNLKTIISLVFCLAISFQNETLAQENGLYNGFRFGVGVDAKLDNITSGEKIKEGVAIQFGYAGNMQILNWVGLDFGAFVAKRSSELISSFYDPVSNSEIDYETSVSAVSFNIPLLPKFRMGKGNAKFKLTGGPSFNYLIEVGKSKSYSDASYNDKYSYENRKIEQQNILEIELIGGIGVEMPIYGNGIISFDYHYHYPVNYVGTINGDKFKFIGSVLGITLMYKSQN